MIPPEVQARLEAAREQRAARETAWEIASAEAEIQIEALIAEYSRTVGALDVDFTVFRTNAGVVAVKRGEVLTYQTFKNSPGVVPTESQFYAFVKPNVLYPEGAAFDALKDKHGDLLAMCAASIKALHGVRIQRERGE